MAENAAEAATQKAASPMKLILVMIIGAVLLVLVSMGGVFFLMKSAGMLNQGGGGGNGSGSAHEEMQLPAIYHALDPAFVVNYKERGRTRFLQVTMQVMTRDPLVVEQLTTHMPLIRNNLLLLLSSQTAETLHSPDGKENIREAALAEINKVLETESGEEPGGVEAVYFTSFVMQ